MILKSSIGQKLLMAATGIFMIVFIVMHLLGNLAMFSGPEAMNSYAAFLKSIPVPLWALRFLTLFSFVTHIFLSIKLSLENKEARPEKYLSKTNIKATLSSRTMMYSGILLLSFILFHLSHLTFGLTHPEHFSFTDQLGRHDVYKMTVLGFQNIYVSCFYFIAQISLGLHLSHGFSSSAQTFGLPNRPYGIYLKRFGVTFSIVICVLYSSIPFSVLMGWVR